MEWLAWLFRELYALAHPAHKRWPDGSFHMTAPAPIPVMARFWAYMHDEAVSTQYAWDASLDRWRFRLWLVRLHVTSPRRTLHNLITR
jgi:hypothetical protein